MKAILPAVDFEQMVIHSLDITGSIDQFGYIQYVSDACNRILGYERSELTGRHYTEFLHPEDSSITHEAILAIYESNKKTFFENRYIHKEGHAVCIRWYSVWSESDQVLYCVGRDMTAKKNSQLRLEETEQRYKALFDNSPDIIFAENKAGLITEVNQRFWETLNNSKERVLGSPASSFLSPEMAAINAKYLEQALLGNYMRFDLELEQDGKIRIFDTLKHPIIINNEITGVQNIARDITSEVRSYDIIKRQAKRLNTIFESITNGFFTLDRKWKFTYINSEAAKLMNLQQGNVIGNSFWDIFPNKVNGKFYEQYHYAVETNKAVQFEAYSKENDKWVEAKAFPSEEGLSVYFDDITERVKAKQELEKLSLVASKTTHGVIITDADGLTEWVNEGFTNLTGLLPSEIIGKKPGALLQGAETDKATIQLMRENLKSAVPFNTKLINYKKCGGKVWLSMDITPIFDQDGKVIRFIAIQKDISERIATQQELELLSLVASKVNNGVIIADKDDKIEWVNDGFIRLTGYSLEEVVGKRAADLLRNAKTDTRAYEAVKDSMFRGEPVAFEILNSRKNGEDIWLSVQVSPTRNEKGELSKFVAIQTDITERVKTQQELEKLSLVASNTTNGVIITDSSRRIDWVNKGFTRLTGYTLEEAVGKIPSEFLHSPKTNTRLFDAVKDDMERGLPTSFKIKNVKKNGEDIWFSIQVNPIHDEHQALTGFVTIQTDITELVKSKEELEKLSLVASKTKNGVLIADKDWHIEWVNEGFTRLYGYTLEEAIGKKPAALLHNRKTDRKSFKVLEASLLRGESISFDVLNSKKNGEEIWLNVEITPVIDESGELSRFIVVQTDITALKNSQLESSKLTRELYKQNSDLQQFSYIVSHNLRSPVANAVGLASLLSNIQKDSPLFDLTISNLKQSVSQLDTVVRDINTILTIRDSKGNLEQELVDVNSVIEEVLSSLRESLQQCGGKVKNSIEACTTVKVNKAYLYSIFYNFLSNAIKYRSDERNLQVRIKSFGNSEKGILFSFSDNGSGFDMTKANGSVFKLYKRFHANKKGRGIGLYLVKTHLEAMDGHVEVTSKVGVGTKFLIYLPKI